MNENKQTFDRDIQTWDVTEEVDGWSDTQTQITPVSVHASKQYQKGVRRSFGFSMKLTVKERAILTAIVFTAVLIGTLAGIIKDIYMGVLTSVTLLFVSLYISAIVILKTSDITDRRVWKITYIVGAIIAVILIMLFVAITLIRRTTL